MVFRCAYEKTSDGLSLANIDGVLTAVGGVVPYRMGYKFEIFLFLHVRLYVAAEPGEEFGAVVHDGPEVFARLL